MLTDRITESPLLYSGCLHHGWSQEVLDAKASFCSSGPKTDGKQQKQRTEQTYVNQVHSSWLQCLDFKTFRMYLDPIGSFNICRFHSGMHWPTCEASTTGSWTRTYHGLKASAWKHLLEALMRNIYSIEQCQNIWQLYASCIFVADILRHQWRVLLIRHICISACKSSAVSSAWNCCTEPLALRHYLRAHSSEFSTCRSTATTYVLTALSALNHDATEASQ